MKQVLIQGGRAVVHEMPAPRCGRGEVLVRAAYSLISPGTEGGTLRGSAEAGGASWTRRLRKIGEVVRTARDRGLAATRDVVSDRLAGPCQVTGYSLAGEVIEVGADVHDLVPGQRVACAGAGSAHHAEVVAVPRNLVVPVPEPLELEQAAFVTLGAIALQGVRQADLRLGEIGYVLGLGLVGRLTAGLLKAAGARVWGSDLDPGRVEAARGLGLELGLAGEADTIAREVEQASAGRGVDAVLLTAGTESSEPVRLAMRLVRQRGRVVVVGAVGLDLARDDFYMKEAELRISRSYGPGRYDEQYEQRGRDYPYGYVRWTENRNMQEFLRLCASGSLDLGPLSEHVVPVERAAEAYRALTRGPIGERPLAVLLRYPAGGAAGLPVRSVPVAAPMRRERIGVALVGPGSFAAGVHLPNLALQKRATLQAVVGRSANRARELARRWSAPLASTDLDEILRDASVDLALICTRHDLHADQAARALAAGKAVFLEKPAALSLDQLQRLQSAVDEAGRPFVVGFNRRFAPDVRLLLPRLAARRGPLVAQYRVNAGALPLDHWARGPAGGGRLIGEACHMIDLLQFLVGSPRTAHRLLPLAPPEGPGDLLHGDNFSLSCRHADGSLTQLLYLSVGHPAAGKERLELHWDGHTAVIDDFRGLAVHGSEGEPARQRPDKGHLELLNRFVAHVAGAGEAPMATDGIFEVSRFVLELDRELRGQDGPSAPLAVP